MEILKEPLVTKIRHFQVNYKVTSTGQLIAGIVAKSKRIAQKAASLGTFSTSKNGATLASNSYSYRFRFSFFDVTIIFLNNSF